MKTRKLICILLSVVLVFVLSGSALALALDRISIGTIDTVEGIVEPKVYSTVSLDDNFADNRVMVVLNNAASLKLKTYTAADFPEIQCASVNDLSTATAARVSAKLRGENVAEVFGAKSESVVFSDFYEVNSTTYNQILCLTLPTAGKQNVLEAIKLLMQRDDVKYAGPDYAVSLAAVTPNDTYYNRQWGLPKIKAPQAWDITTGSSSVLVGVLDTGINISHSDLSGQVNTAKSRDFIGSGSATQDPHGHGTHAAGTIAGKANSTGIVGVAHNVRLVSLKVLDASGNGYASTIAEAINYAEAQNIPILNLSADWEISEPAFDFHIEETIENYSGLLVCAAGNDGANLDGNIEIYPAEHTLPNILVVGASTENDTRWDYSAYETERSSNYSAVSVDIFAPGEGIFSAYLLGTCTEFEGTACAVPHATGVAALMLSECDELSASDIRLKIIANDDNVSALAGLCVSGGRLNAYKAVSKAHTFTTYTKTATAHTGTCSCGDTKTEAHTYTSVGSRYVCSVCGYITMNP